ncbi:MAG: hypothetical protein ACKVG6_05095 [Alphaproteobacteria bacterium]|jgi:hypothetical protein
MSDIQMKSETSCPQCGHKAMEMLPEDACQFSTIARGAVLY